MRAVRPWPRLPREAVAAPFLAVFKAWPWLDGALSTLGWWKMSLLMAGRLEPDDLYDPFQPKPFYDSMILSCWNKPPPAPRPLAERGCSLPSSLRAVLGWVGASRCSPSPLLLVTRLDKGPRSDDVDEVGALSFHVR